MPMIEDFEVEPGELLRKLIPYCRNEYHRMATRARYGGILPVGPDRYNDLVWYAAGGMRCWISEDDMPPEFVAGLVRREASRMATDLNLPIHVEIHQNTAYPWEARMRASDRGIEKFKGYAMRQIYDRGRPPAPPPTGAP